MAAPNEHVHGSNGAWVAGEWLDIEDCAEHFNIQGASHTTGTLTRNCATCPRSRTRHGAARGDGSYDVAIIGAGCIGSAIARELSKFKLSVLMLEAADDVTQGATKGNSGIVHAGFDDKPGSVRAKYCWPGNQMFSALDRDLHFGFQKNGSLVVARGEEDEQMLEELKQRGQTNGVQNLRIVDRAELRRMEPHIHPEATAALWSPDAGTVVPYEYAIALAENAADNGVEVRIRREVTAITTPSDADAPFSLEVQHWEPAAYVAVTESQQRGRALLGGLGGATAVVLLASLSAGAGADSPMLGLSAQQLGRAGALLLCACCAAAAYWKAGTSDAGRTVGDGKGGLVTQDGNPLGVEALFVGGSGSRHAHKGKVVETETVRARYVVNCAGCASDKVAAMVGDDSFTVKPRMGEYVLLHKDQGHLCNATLFPAPGKMGKGVLVQATLWGNLILGPTARDVHAGGTREDKAEDVMSYIFSKCRNLVPSFDASTVIHSFSGARAKSTRGDWIIEPSAAHERFLHAAGIDSPGLAGSPAIAQQVVQLLKQAGLSMAADPSFNPKRAPLIVPKQGAKGLKYGPPGKEKDPKKAVICKCEKVTEHEVLECLRRSLPLDSTQAVRKRVRCGMGHCQADEGNYDCEGRVAALLARELSVPTAAVGRRPWPATSMLPQRWLEEGQRDTIDSTSGLAGGGQGPDEASRARAPSRSPTAAAKRGGF